MVSSGSSHVQPSGFSSHRAKSEDDGNPRQIAQVRQDGPHPASQSGTALSPLRPLPAGTPQGPPWGGARGSGESQCYHSGEGPGLCWLPSRQAASLASGYSGNVNSTFGSWVFLAPRAADLSRCCLGPSSPSSPRDSAWLAIRCWSLLEQQERRGEGGHCQGPLGRGPWRCVPQRLACPPSSPGRGSPQSPDSAPAVPHPQPGSPPPPSASHCLTRGLPEPPD